MASTSPEVAGGLCGVAPSVTRLRRPVWDVELTNRDSNDDELVAMAGMSSCLFAGGLWGSPPK